MDAWECNSARDAIAELIERRLASVREAISRELSSIPMPVPGCDVNFNRLLEDRSRVVDALQRLAKLRGIGAQPAEYAGFAETCVWLDQATRDRIAEALERGNTLAGLRC